MSNYLKKAAEKSVYLIIAKFIFTNFRVGMRYGRGDHTPELRPNQSFHLSPTDYLANMEKAFESYLRNGDITLQTIQGADILELGPGDSFAMALNFIAHGANRVVCLDRFKGIQCGEAARAVYSEMRARLNDEQKARFDQAVRLDESVTINTDKIRYISDTGIEDAERILAGTRFDLIVSMAVLEHIYDGNAAFDAMDRLLKPSGFMIHGVDLRDHGMFSQKGHHPLTFLNINGFLYKLMASNTGLPNRIWLPFYRRKLSELNYTYRILIASVVGRDTQINPHKEHLVFGVDFFQNTLDIIDSIRSRLSYDFKTLTDEDLMVTTFIVSARKMS